MDLEVSGHENGSPCKTELGSGKQERRSGLDCEEEEDIWRNSKLSRTDKTMSFHKGIPLLRSNEPRRQEHMLSFSSDKSDVSPYLQYFRNSGYGIGGMMNTNNNNNNMKGPFSLSQWAELEQQALIYKYITSNVPVPSTLLVSLKKSFFPYASLPPPNSYGWGSFHLGFSGGNMDPEPGRCRRTDGKKWRCSRDAVPDQKYCERHINRGRHRSRKPVEGLNGHNNTNAATVTSAASTAAAKAAARTAVAAMRGSNSTNNNSLAAAAAVGAHGHVNASTTDSLSNRVPNTRGSSVYPTAMNLQPKQSHPPKQTNNNNPFEFGLIPSDSLLKQSSSKGFGSYLDFTNQEKHSENVDSWPESDWTQLSMSIPMASSSSPQEKLALSPLRLSSSSSSRAEFGSEFIEKKTNNWLPISWGSNNNSMMGGPLGEVLNSTANSPKFGSSPTGVLQKSMFGCLSNSNSGSSHVDKNGGGDGKDQLGLTTLMKSSDIAPL